MIRTRHNLIACACFLGSGFLAPAAEIIWIRKASLVFGAATFALNTVPAVFFASLAPDSYVFGRYSPRETRPLAVVMDGSLPILPSCLQHSQGTNW